MISKQPIIPHHIRWISGSFSWIDHRLLSDGFLATMSQGEMLLYFSLVLVGDKNGVSLYSYDNIWSFLQLDPHQFLRARDRFLATSLIACENGRLQLLQLPTPNKNLVTMRQASSDNPQSRAQIFKKLANLTP